MGGASTACSTRTKKVLLECAYFNPESIIGKSIKYNLIQMLHISLKEVLILHAHEMVLRRFVKVVQDHAKINQLKLNHFLQRAKISSIPIDIHK